jgi:hypothetical protein
VQQPPGLLARSRCGVTGVYFGGAYYLGQSRGGASWSDFAASGAAAGAGLSAVLLPAWPPRARTAGFGALLGAALGAVSGATVQVRAPAGGSGETAAGGFQLFGAVVRGKARCGHACGCLPIGAWAGTRSLPGMMSTQATRRQCGRRCLCPRKA